MVPDNPAVVAVDTHKRVKLELLLQVDMADMVEQEQLAQLEEHLLIQYLTQVVVAEVLGVLPLLPERAELVVEVLEE